MKQAITTRYAGPTNTRGSRIIAKANAGSIAIPYGYEGSPDQEHTKAARALVEKLAKAGGYGWCGMWVSGGMPDDRGNCYVNIGHAAYAGKLNPHLIYGTEGSDWFYVSTSAAGEA